MNDLPADTAARLRLSGARFTTRPVITSRRGVITSGHYLASAAGTRMYARGGNAVDAGAAAGFALAVLKPQDNGIGGECPMLIHDPRTSRVVAISGQGTAPARATVEFFREVGIRLIPGNGLLAATVPATFDAWLIALSEFGTMSLREVMEPALELAADGFAMYPALLATIHRHHERFQAHWPTSAAIYRPGGRVPDIGDRFVQRDWAAGMSRTVEAEDAALRAGAGRRAALLAARDVFYKGFIAEAIARFAAETSVLDQSGSSHSGLISYDDMAGYQGRIEEPATVDYRGYQVYKCGPWTQGPVFLQQLRLLEEHDLRAMGHNSPSYIHLLAEVAKLAFADRDRYYGDPLFGEIPMDRLLSRSYARERGQLIDWTAASTTIRAGEIDTTAIRQPDDGAHRRDTTHLDAIDADGLMISATPSGGWMASSPVVEGLGFPLGTRAQMFWLDPLHPDGLLPGKRPRTTLTPSLVTRDGAPYMVFGTKGGDQQDQWTLQFFLNVVEFGMDLQAALDAPLFHTDHFPASFYPRETQLGSLTLEDRIAPATRLALEGLGHDITVADAWENGEVCGARFDAASGRIEAAASPRGVAAYAMGY